MENKDLLKGMENASVYREMFLTRKMTGARRQTYIDESLYETLTGILPAGNICTHVREQCVGGAYGEVPGYH